MKSHPIEVSEKRGVRYLHFGSSWIQGAMRINRPDVLELAYTREMMAVLLLHPDAVWGEQADSGWPQRILMIGLGAASLAKFVHRYLPQSHCTVVEINPQVLAVARQSFNLPPESARFDIVIDDGVTYLANSNEHYDLILVDGFGPDARAGGLDTPDFYSECRNHLKEDGFLVCNLLGRSKGFDLSKERIQAVFAGNVLIFPSCESGNAIAFASSGCDLQVLQPAALKSAAQDLQEKTLLNLSPTLARLEGG